MTEFLHQVVANREYIQRDMTLHRRFLASAMRQQNRDEAAQRLLDIMFDRTNDPWELAEDANE